MEAKEKHKSYLTAGQMFLQAGHFLIKQRFRSEGRRVIKVKGSGNVLAERPSCGSDTLWGQRSARELYEHAWEYVQHPLFLQVDCI